MADIQSTAVPLELSDNGSTWRTLVCLTGYNFPIEKSVTETETFCGKSVGLGSTSFNPNGTAVCKADNSTNEWTWKELLDRMEAEQIVYFRVAYPASGSVSGPIYLTGTCYITQLELQLETSAAIQFTFTLTGTGTLDYQYP